MLKGTYIKYASTKQTEKERLSYEYPQHWHEVALAEENFSYKHKNNHIKVYKMILNQDTITVVMFQKAYWWLNGHTQKVCNIKILFKMLP